MNPKISRRYQSVGYLAAGLEISVEVVSQALKVLGAQPAIILNGKPYYDRDTFEKLVRHLDDCGLIPHIGTNR